MEQWNDANQPWPMEAMMLDLDYADLLFTPEELRMANERLQAAQQMF